MQDHRAAGRHLLRQPERLPRPRLGVGTKEMGHVCQYIEVDTREMEQRTSGQERESSCYGLYSIICIAHLLPCHLDEYPPDDPT